MYTLTYSQNLPLTLEQAWEFISSPKNLKTITPEFMGFDIISSIEEKMYAGMIIQYKVRPILHIPIHWVTEITHVQEPFFFVDEQRFGPYSFWHHQHILQKTDTGVEMKDIIHYKPPFGILGKMMNSLIIKKQIEKIFLFRYKKLEELFSIKK